jgi:hypothetical protein
VDQLRAWKTRTIVCALLLLLVAAWVPTLRAPQMALFLVQTQDVPVLLLLSCSMLLVAAWRPEWRLPARLPPNWVLLLAGLAVAALLAWGAYALLGNFPLSRDEHMVVFDMAVFEKGRLAAPVEPAWRGYALAMVPNFLLNWNQPIGVVSAYLPVNAMLRLAFSKIADPVWFNPLLVVIGGAALLDIARRTFGPQDRACWVALLVYVLSAQVLVNAMTTYSMPGHLALNLVWLAAFLRGGRLWNSVAIAVGFLATGLHQVAFHPFFVAPFLLWKLRDGEWKLVLLYAAAYAAIVAWWIYYPILVSSQVAQGTGNASVDNFLTERVIPLLMIRDPRTFGLMTLNLLRFVSWQNFALLPLLVAAVPIAVRERGFAGALLLGIVAWLVFLTVLLPEQGRGWGFRYLHPYLGSFALLAGFGYRELERRIGSRADGMVLLMSGVTLIAAIPLLFTAAYRFMQPHLAMDRLVAAQATPFVLIDDNSSRSTDGSWADEAIDHVRNLPDFENRPLRFSADVLPATLLAELCRLGPVTLIRKADMHRVGFALNMPARSARFDALVKSAERETPGCFRVVNTSFTKSS